MQNSSPIESLSAAVHRCGSQSAFARLCGVSQTAVWKWLQSGKRLPAEYVLVVERETGVSRHLLRPDIYPLTDTLPPLPDEAVVSREFASDHCNRHDILQRSAAA